MKTLNCVLIFGGLLLSGPNLWAIPPGFNIQGRLTDANGINKDGEFQIKFSIFDAANNLKWEKNIPGMHVQNGNFQVVLRGQGDSSVQYIELENAVKDLQDAYVEIKVGSDPPLVPRQPLLRSPFFSSGVPIGTIITYASVTKPQGWLYCNGDTFNRTAYPDLFEKIGCSFGCPDASTFNVPDLRGQFVRGFDTLGSVDPGRVFGSTQMDEFKTHAHSDNTFQQISATWRGGGGYSPGDATGRSAMIATSGETGGTETRPRNVALLYIIKH